MADNIILIIGLIAASLTTFAFLPQSIKAIKTKHTKDLSIHTLLMLVSGIGLWLIYGILISNIPLIASNGISFVLMATMLYLKIKYG
ncbi:MAG TPA: SemiSWEET transporter [Ignavibacteria bacterium]